MKDHNTNAQWAEKLASAVRECTIQKEAHDIQAAELRLVNVKLYRAEKRVTRINHLYAFISQVNQKIVRLKEEGDLFINACDIALEFGKFKMAWIGLFDDTRKKVILAEQRGIPANEIHLFDNMPYQSGGPQDHVLRSGTYYICNDAANELELENWKPFAALYNIHSCMVLPIKRSGHIIGTLNLYSTELDFAGPEEIKLLIEVTGDISFALDLFEKEKQHKKEEEEINASEMLYHSLFDNMQEGFAYCKMLYKNGVAEDFMYLDVNGAFKKLTGLKNVVGENVSMLIPGFKQDNPELLHIYDQVALSGKPQRTEVYLSALKMWLDISVFSTEKGYFTAVFDVVTEKKLSKEKLENSEKLFRALIEKDSDMKTLTDGHGKMLYSSPAVCNILGYSVEEYSHKYPRDIIHPDEIESYLLSRAAILEIPGNHFLFQQRRMHKTGIWVWCEGSVTNMLHEPAVNALVSNFRDVSSKKMTEQQKEFDKNNLAALINNTGDLMWSVDKDFNLITANQAFGEAMIAAFGQVIAPGSSMFSVPYPQVVLDRFKQLYERAFAGKSFIEVEHFEIPLETWLEVSYHPIRRGDEVIGTACHSRDITASKLAEKELAQSEASLNEAQAIVHISNWEVDLLNGMNTWSDEFYNIVEEKEGNITPSLEVFLAQIHPDDINYVAGIIKESYATFKNSRFNARLKTKNGSIKYIYSEYRFEFDSTNKPIRLYGILQDVTERKEAEEKIRELNEHLEKRVEERTAELLEANKALEAFSYSVSHDLRSPVRSVMGFARLIEKNHLADLNPDAKELFSHIEESGKRMNAIIDDLLNFAKWGKEKLNLAEVDMTALFNHVWENILLESTHNAVLQLQPLPKVQADMAMIRQVVVNLVSNAVKYSSKKEKPVVKVGFEETEDEIIFYVNDNGAGFDMKNYDRLFGAFQRLHGMTEFEGTGIGLTLIKTIIEKHKGRVWAKGEIGQGATFWFSLPKMVIKL